MLSKKNKLQAKALLFSLVFVFFYSFYSFYSLADVVLNNSNQFSKSVINHENKINFYEPNIPKEVQEAVTKIRSKYPNATISVSNTEVGPKTRGSSSSWGAYRTYKKHKIRDWIITTTASYPLTTIKNNSTASYFIENCLWIAAGTAVGSFNTYLGAGVSAIQAIASRQKNPSPSGSDILQVAPTFTCKEKFTYVYIGKEYFLGTKSYYSRINTMSWRLYLANSHKNYYKEISYNKQFKTPSYDAPDSKAIIYYGSSGYLETPPSLKIGNITFALS